MSGHRTENKTEWDRNKTEWDKNKTEWDRNRTGPGGDDRIE
jgi:hypothetical protein